MPSGGWKKGWPEVAKDRFKRHPKREAKRLHCRSCKTDFYEYRTIFRDGTLYKHCPRCMTVLLTEKKKP